MKSALHFSTQIRTAISGESVRSLSISIWLIFQSISHALRLVARPVTPAGKRPNGDGNQNRRNQTSRTQAHRLRHRRIFSICHSPTEVVEELDRPEGRRLHRIADSKASIVSVRIELWDLRVEERDRQREGDRDDSKCRDRSPHSG